MSDILALLLLLAANTSQDNHGAAYYGIQHPDWNCSQSLAALKDKPVKRISILWSTFGRDEACLRRFLDLPEKRMLLTHLINEVCIRNRDCPWYEFGAGYSLSRYEKAVSRAGPRFRRKLDAYIKPLAALMAEYQSERFTCLISPGLESNLSARAMQRFIKVLRPYFPGCKFVSHGNLVKGASYAEYHTLSARPPCILSNDDAKWPGSLASWRRIAPACKAFFAWHPGFNGWERNFVDADRRNRKGWPNKRTFSWLRGEI